MAAKDYVDLSFELVGDQYPHAWHFNCFRIEKFGAGVSINFMLRTEADGLLAANAVTLGKADWDHAKGRAKGYLKELGVEKVEPTYVATSNKPPARVYPVNHVSLARVGELAEIGFYRYSVSTLVDTIRMLKSPKQASKATAVKCYPVVMFRSDLDVQVELMYEMLSLE